MSSDIKNILKDIFKDNNTRTLEGAELEAKLVDMLLNDYVQKYKLI